MRRPSTWSGVGLLVAAMSVAALAAPASAAQPVHDSYRISGDLAKAMWFSEVDVPVGTPGMVYVMGADAMSVQHAIGGRPQRVEQPALVAMSLMLPGALPGDDPYPAELWCVTDAADFVMADDLSAAELSIGSCEAQVVVVDPETGEEGPNGVVLTLSASVRWTAVGDLETQRSHSRYETPGAWSMDMVRTASRSATAEIEVVLPGGMVSTEATEASLQTVKVASIVHD